MLFSWLSPAWRQAGSRLLGLLLLGALVVLLGQTISTSPFQGSTVAVPTAGLAPGMYLMSIKTPTQVEATSRI